MPSLCSTSVCLAVAGILLFSTASHSLADPGDSRALLRAGDLATFATLGADRPLTAQVERRGPALTLTVEQIGGADAPLVARLPFAGDGQRHRLILRGDEAEGEAVPDLMLDAVREGDAIRLTARTDGGDTAFRAAMR